MLNISEKTAQKLVLVFDQLIMETEDETMILRGHKVSRDGGLSWEKTNRREVLNTARQMLYDLQSAEAGTAKTRVRSKADPD